MADPIGTNTVTAIARRYLMPSFFGPPPTEEEIRRNRARKAAEWAENSAAGLVAITSGTEDDHYVRADRGSYIDRWVSQESWDNYLFALGAFKQAEADLA